MSLINIQKTVYKVGDFLAWYKKGSLLLSPEFQRRAVWKKGTKSYLIDTIAKGLSIPIIFLRDRGINLETFEPIREVIDGQQRLRTVIAYVQPTLLNDFNQEKDTFTVYTTHNQQLAGKTFRELPADFQRYILEYQFSVHILPSDVDDREVFQIFRRINSTDYTINPQELRNASFFGEFKTSMYQLAMEQLPRWRRWQTFTEDNIARMDEVELTSELVLLMLDGKINGKSQSFIESAYQKYDTHFPQRIEIENRFRIVFDVIDDTFGHDMANLPFGTKTFIYVFFASIYDRLFQLKPFILEEKKPQSIMPEYLQWLTKVGEELQQKTAPQKVLNAMQKSTTNLDVRTILFDYLQKTFF